MCLLVAMQSGIGNIFGPKFEATPKDRLRRNADFLPLFAAEPLLFEPGKESRYSNGGYVVLGEVIARVSGDARSGLPVGIVRQMLAEGIVERNATLFDELPQRHLREELVDRPEVELGVRAVGESELAAGQPPGLVKKGATLARHENHTRERVGCRRLAYRLPVVVMPFADLSPAKDQEYFTLGLTEELVNRLARLPDLRVAAYKRRSEDSRDVGRQLRVSTVLEGSVRKAGNRLRITVQLAKVSDGYHLWSDTYDRTLDDIFAVQDEIARSVASALQVTLLVAGRSAHAGNPEAYNLVLQAQYLRNKGGRDAYATALGLLQQAARLDPGNARVFAEMSRIYFARASEGFAGDADYGESWRAANHAVELDPGLADAHQALGWFSMAKNWDWSAADASFKKALALEPRNVRALRSAAALAGAVGRFDEAITLGKRATELEPTNGQIYYNLCIYQRKGGQSDGALLSGRQALELDPKLSWAHFQLGAVYLVKGNIEEAIREFEQESDDTFKARGLAMGY